MAIVVTNISAAMGGLTWVLLGFSRGKKLSVMGFCAGAVSGLVAITPASGYVGPAPALIFGFLGAAACRLACYLQKRLGVDDAVDVFAVHGVGGVVGNLLTGIFAQKSIAELDGTVIEGGWIDRHFIQLGYQTADSCAGLAWSFTLTFIILIIMDKIPGLSLRADEETEKLGIDMVELGEMAYDFTTLPDTSEKSVTISESK
eukprot:TRINITY_DN663_c0_g1_i3.p1 TRINITY_DN663_c0_g1~~TRINITY_DN663_c0_g1_i3.p1  ORF type:complete len:202 (+),score=52.70 TRINITY_DN663_c0_g1_i3:192-797(+)